MDTTLLASAVLPAAVGLSDQGVGEELRRAIRESRRWDARQAELVAEAEQRGLAGKEGFASTTAWLMAVSGEPVPVCRNQVAVAEALETMPQTRAAFRAGVVSESRVKLLARAQALAPEQFAKDEARLVAQLASASSKQAPRVLAAWKQETDPEAAEAQVQRLHSLRALHVSEGWDDMVHLDGQLDPADGLVVLTALQHLSESAALDSADRRTPAQCRADALVEICHRYLNGEHPTGASRPQVTVTVPWNLLQTGRGIISTDSGPIDGQTARRLACDATISRVILDAEGIPVEAGRARRLIPPALRRALDLRDQHCTHPGCDTPARWCDAHHVIPWADGGKTEPSNLHLLCRRHHREAHHHQPYPERR